MDILYHLPGQQNRTFEPWFEEQFADRERFESPGGHITVSDVIPPDFDSQQDQTPVVFVPGFLTNLDGYKLTMQAFAKSGKRVVGLNHSNRTGRRDHGQSVHGAIVQKADDLLTLVDVLGDTSSDVVAHSEGFIVSILASRIRAEASDSSHPFREVLGVAPAGLKRLDLQDALRGPGMIASGALDMLMHPNRRRIAVSTVRYIGKNMLKIPREGLALLGTEVLGMVNDLAAEIDIGVLLGARDEVISAQKLRRLFDQGRIGVSAVMTVEGRKTTHAGILNDPKTIASAIMMLDEMRSHHLSQTTSNQSDFLVGSGT